MTAKNTSLNNEVITKNVPVIQPSLEKGNEAKPATKEEKAALDAMIKKFAPVVKPSAEERINRKEQFDALCARFKFLKGKSNDLKLFMAGNDKTNTKIVLKNQSGYEVEVRNSNVIDKVLFAMSTELEILLSDSENEVLNFEV